MNYRGPCYLAIVSCQQVVALSHIPVCRPSSLLTGEGGRGGDRKEAYHTTARKAGPLYPVTYWLLSCETLPIKYLKGRTVSKLIIDNLANFLSISPNQTKFFLSVCLVPAKLFGFSSFTLLHHSNPLGFNIFISVSIYPLAAYVFVPSVSRKIFQS